MTRNEKIMEVIERLSKLEKEREDIRLAYYMGGTIDQRAGFIDLEIKALRSILQETMNITTVQESK
jgi:hypothetical protein